MRIHWPSLFFAAAVGALALISSSADASTYNFRGFGVWHPTLNLNEVTVMINWMAKGQKAFCGEHGKVRGCAFPATADDIPRKGKVCEITHPGFPNKYTPEDFRVLGELFETCLEKMGTRIITVRFKVNGSEISVRPTDTYVMALPCGMTIAMDVITETKGHELLHCKRGTWHD